MSSWSNAQYLEWIEDGYDVDTCIVQLYVYKLGIAIPSKIGNLRNLQTLNMSFNSLTAIPAEIGNLINLQIINFSDNKISTLPVEIGNLHNLQRLDLSFNDLTVVPSEIGNLNNLQLLCLSDNQLTTIPPEIGNLQSIKTLDLYKNQITTIPHEIGNLRTLQVLHLSFNNISEIPDEIGNLTALQTLGLSNNTLKTIPSSIGNLHAIREFYLYSNQITAIPAEIGNIRSLQSFDISGNKITNLPAELGTLPNITSLNLFNNPIEYLPPNIRRIVERQRQSQGIYGDKQSVHNSMVQATIKSSIMRLLSIPPSLGSDAVISDILSDNTLSDFTKQSLVEYSRNTDVISDLNVTFLEVLTAVWNRVVTNENSNDIKHVLNGEMKDAECKCFTGRVSRLVNCLSGIDSLVDVKISDNEQIGNVISVVGERLKDEGRYTIELHEKIASNNLKKMGYSIEEIVKGWIDYLE